jgi:8-oxo-dGTP pyrophosphatase MutT (NUDIX family)
MPGHAAKRMAAQLDAGQRAYLRSLLDEACQPLPADWLAFQLGPWRIGAIAPQRVGPALAVLPGSFVSDDGLHWPAAALSPAERSAQIRQAAERLQALGLVRGWRHEAYRCEVPVDEALSRQGEALFELERAAFRFFGLTSRAVHITGFAGDRLWCGRRAPNKAIDPGRLDNLAAGGLPAGEAFAACAVRELHEEAGVPAHIATGIAPGGALRCTRVEPEGLHDEVLHIYALALPPGFAPRNQDGEVSEFLHLDGAQLLARLQGGEFTLDAAAVIARALLDGDLPRAESRHGDN